MTAMTIGADELIDPVRRAADAAGAFGPVAVREGRLICHAKAAAEPASYRLGFEGGTLWVSLVTADRWLSESIEADLMHTGDKIEDLIAEELVELGGARPAGGIKCEHFRSDDMLFTFRTPVPADAASATRYLLAYEACFRRLGDMGAGE